MKSDETLGNGPLFSNIDKSEEVRLQRSHEALRLFTVDLKSDDIDICNSLFSCSTCEQYLCARDIYEQVFSPSVSVGKKRFDAVILDGTVAGILERRTYFHRPSTIISFHQNLRRGQ